MSVVDLTLIIVALFLCAAALYTVRALRIIGNKISQLHAALKRNEKVIGDQIQDLVAQTSALQLSNSYPNSRERARLKYVLSLTSHPARFAALESLIPSLSNQLLEPTEIYLNIAEADISKLTDSLKRTLKSAGVKVCAVADLGPGKKLIPTLAKTNLPVICIDDDLVLPYDLTFQLMALHRQYPNDVIASRTHRITADSQGNPKKFAEWNLEYNRSSNPEPNLLATSGAGTLFPNGALHRDAQDEKLYRELAFHTDDLWWYFQARRNGTNVRRIPGRRALAFIEGTQEVGLWVTGNQERNDQNFSRLVAKYGNPLDKSKLR